MARAPTSIPPPPFPSVRFEPGFARRIERFTAALSAAHTRREELGTQAGSHGGPEFVGYRAYARGDDLRRIDWSLYARLDRAFVRVTRREAGEAWSIVLDASASMGVGPPGKLQRAAEIAAALAALALRSSARATVHVLGRRHPPVVVAKRADLARLLAFLEGLEAHGVAGPDDLQPLRRPLAGAARVFVVSDLLTLEPEHVVDLSSARRSVTAIRVLAPLEIAAEDEGTVEWFDPESGGRLAVDVAQTGARYERVLTSELERWRASCARSRVRLSTSSSALAFEAILARSLAP